MNSKNLFLGFAGMISAAAVWAIWGNDMFPAEQDPTGDPEDWTADELKRWLRLRDLLPNARATREELLEQVKANFRVPRSSGQ